LSRAELEEALVVVDGVAQVIEGAAAALGADEPEHGILTPVRAARV
jgi:hypothetical protein